MKTIDSSEFEDRLRARPGGVHGPLAVLWESTHRCNFRCPHCYVPRPPGPEMVTAEAIAVLRSLAGAGCLRIGFSGGEPFMREDLPELLRAARRAGMRSTILTNGSLVDAAAARMLAELGPSLAGVDVSLPAATEAAAAVVTGVRGAAAAAVRAIDALRDAGVPVRVKAVALRANARELGPMRRIALERGLPFRFGWRLYPRTDGDRSPLVLQLSAAELADALAAAGAPEEDARPGGGGGGLFRCGAGEAQAALSPAGRLILCPQAARPSAAVRPGGAARAWKRFRAEAARFAQEIDVPCSRCPVRGWCGWCPALAAAPGATIPEPGGPACADALFLARRDPRRAFSQAAWDRFVRSEREARGR